MLVTKPPAYQLQGIRMHACIIRDLRGKAQIIDKEHPSQALSQMRTLLVIAAKHSRPVTCARKML
jgi:hypothetical protein